MGRCVRPWPFGGKATNCATCSRTIGRKVSPPVALTARRPSGLTASAGSIFGCRSKLLSDRKFAIDDAFLPAALTASPLGQVGAAGLARGYAPASLPRAFVIELQSERNGLRVQFRRRAIDRQRAEAPPNLLGRAASRR